MRGRIIALVLSLCAAVQPGEAEARPARRDPPPPSLIGANSPDWSWVQVLAAPRIGGRLSSVAVDPKNPDRIYVGTEEGNILRSADGGVTWDERFPTPFTVQARSTGGVKKIEPPDPDDANSANTTFFGDPPNRFYADDLAIPAIESLVFSGLPLGLGTNNIPYIATGGSVDISLLQDVVEPRQGESIPVQRIAVCPGAKYPLLVATTDALYGSTDEGLTFVRLFFVQDDGEIDDIACSPYTTAELAVASTNGLYRSKDGGNTFDQVPGQGGSIACAFAREPSHNVEIIFSAVDGELYGGDPDSIYGLDDLYPADDDARTAPWDEIRWIEATRGGEVWLATDDGVRLSRDSGQRFQNVEPNLFGHQPIRQVAVDQGERVAVLMKQGVYSSDDEGVTWHPFFVGITRRSAKQMAVSSGNNGNSQWWIVTTGELWTNIPPGGFRKRENARAKLELENTPSLAATIDRVLDHLHLSLRATQKLIDTENTRNLIPILDFRVTFEAERNQRDRIGTGGMGVITDSDADDEKRLTVMLQATWPFYETRFLVMESPPVAKALLDLRQQIAFAAEDAWNERQLHLSRIARGEVDADQEAMLRARIEALEFLLDQWGWREPAEEE